MKRSTTDLAVVGATAETVMEDAEIRVSDMNAGANETPTLTEPVVIEIAEEPIEVTPVEGTPSDTETLVENNSPVEESSNVENTAIDDTKESVD